MHSNTVQFDKVIDLYQKAFDVAPESELASDIKNTILAVELAKEDYATQQATASESK